MNGARIQYLQVGDAHQSQTNDELHAFEPQPSPATGSPRLEAAAAEAVVDIPNSEVVISRTVRRDNSSEYRIDGARASVKEVADLLRRYHVDIDHNRFLILQVCLFARREHRATQVCLLDWELRV